MASGLDLGHRGHRSATPVLLTLLLAFVIGLCALGESKAQDDDRRLALVIGNSTYSAVTSLPNAVHDSQLIADSLTSLGFEVSHLKDASLDEMKTAISSMAEEANAGNVSAALLYYAGHGFQLGGVNYLVPVDAVLDSRERVSDRTIALDAVIKQLESEDHETIILLDACRDNPLPESIRSKDDGEGLAMVTSGSNTYIAFATRPGGITADGSGDYGPFAAALAEGMTYPDVPISGMMTKVRHAVWTQTGGVQEPWSNDTLHEEFFFNGGDAEAGVTLASAEPVLDSLFDQPVAVAPQAKVAPSLPGAASPSDTPPATNVASTGDAPALQPNVRPADLLPRTVVPNSASQPASTEAAIGTGNTDVARLDSGTPATLRPLQSSSPPVIGVELPEEVPGPGTPPLDPPSVSDPIIVASAMQEELRRIGCYSGKIDGDWGTGSKNALRRYFAAKKQSVPGTDPEEVLLARLSEEGGKVCEPVVAPPKAPKKKPVTATTSTTPKVPKAAKAPAPPKIASDPAPTKPKIKLGAGTGSFR